MEDRPFKDNKLKPDAEKLKPVLNKVFQHYNKLLNLTENFKHDWNFSKSSGWMEKVHDGKKALYYLIPLNDSFKISLAIRESEKEALLADKSLKEFHAILNEAKKFSEGYNIQFMIEDKKSYDSLAEFIKKLVSFRKI
jgi:hypothetical protein